MKILIVRFSSIGDIVLTTPVVRCLKKQVPNCELHYLTKKAYLSLIENNPYIDRVWTIEKKVKEVSESLKEEQFDLIIDLHKNLRTWQLKSAMKKKSYSFDKLNFQKWLLVRFKKSILPDIHIVDRYLKTTEKLGVKNDNQGLDFFFRKDFTFSLESIQLEAQAYLAVAIGAQFATKTLPVELLVDILSKTEGPIVLLGGKEDQVKGEEITKQLKGKNIQNLCGKFSLLESAWIVRHACVLLTHDTGLMHIASAFEVPIVSVWGNTVPELGMYPYAPKNNYSIHQVENLSCRPCSKIGYQTCPKGHFRCMKDQNIPQIIEDLNVRLK